jgi:hypothetical protein
VSVLCIIHTFLFPFIVTDNCSLLVWIASLLFMSGTCVRYRAEKILLQSHFAWCGMLVLGVTWLVCVLYCSAEVGQASRITLGFPRMQFFCGFLHEPPCRMTGQFLTIGPQPLTSNIFYQALNLYILYHPSQSFGGSRPFLGYFCHCSTFLWNTRAQ